MTQPGWIHAYAQSICAHPFFSGARTVAPLWLVAESGEPAAAPARVTIQMAAEIFPRLVIIGPAGIGKTTALRQLTAGLAEGVVNEGRHSSSRRPSQPIPLYIELARFEQSLEHTLAAAFGVEPPSLDDLAHDYPLLFLLDGLDELAPEAQLAGLSAIAERMQAFGPRARWVLTCRAERLTLFRPWIGNAEVRALRPPAQREVLATVQQRCGDPAARWLEHTADLCELATRPRWLAALLGGEISPGQPLLQAPFSRGRLLSDWLPVVLELALEAHPRAIGAGMSLDLLPQIVQLLDPESVALHELHGDVAGSPVRRHAKAPHGSGELALSVADLISALEQSPMPQRRPGRRDLREERLAEAPVHPGARAAVELLFDAGILASEGQRRGVAFTHPTLRAYAQALTLSAVRPEQWPAAAFGRARNDSIVFAYSLSADREALLRRLLASGAVGLAARCLIDAELPEQFERLLDRSAELTPPLRVMLAETFAGEGLIQPALVQLERAAAEGYDEAGLFGRLGDLYSLAGQGQHARAAYEQALARDPEDSRYRRQLGVVYARLGELDLAAATLEVMLETERRRAAQAAHDLGDVYARQGRHERALDVYRRAAESLPSEPLYQRSVGRSLRMLGRLDEAEATLNSLVAVHQSDAAAHAELGLIYGAIGRQRQALHCYTRAVSLAPTEAAYYVEIGRLRASLRDLSGARAALQRAADLNPGDADLLFALGEACEQCGEVGSALEAYRRATRLAPQTAAYWRRLGACLRDNTPIRATDSALDEAEFALRTALDLASDDPAVYHELGRLHQRRAHHDAAIESFRRAWSLAPQVPAYAGALGAALRTAGRHQEARAVLEEGIRQAPADASLHYESARVAEDLEAWDAALAAYEQAVRAAPESAKYTRATGVFLMQRGDRARARAFLAAALRCDRRDAETLYQIGRVHAAAGQWRRAIDALRRATQVAAEPRMLAEYGRALCAEQCYAEAGKAFEQALQMQPDDPDTLLAYSRALTGQGRIETAGATVRHAARLLPGRADLQLYAGQLALRLGRRNEALELLDRAVALDSGLVEAHVSRSEALLDIGRVEAALTGAKTALALLQPDQVQEKSLWSSAQPITSADLLHLARAAWLAGRALFRLRRSDEARRALEVAIGSDPGLAPAHADLRDLLIAGGETAAAVAAAQRVVDLEPTRPEHRIRLGEALLEAGHSQAAVEACEQALAMLDTPHADVTDQYVAFQSRAVLAAAAHAGMSRAAAQQRAWDRARYHAEQALRRVPYQAAYHAILADALLGAGDRPGALAALTRATEYEPDTATWRYRLGLAVQQTDAAAALPHLRQAVQLGDLPEHHRALALCLSELGELPEAVESLERALRQHNAPVAWRVELARMQAVRGWHAEALAELNRVLALNPDDPAIWRMRADVQTRLGNLEAARVDLLESLRRNMQDATGFRMLADLLRRSGNLPSALESARRAVGLDPAPIFRVTLAAVLRALGRLDEAIEQLSSAVQPGSPAEWWAELAEDLWRAGLPGRAQEAHNQAVIAAPDRADLLVRVGTLALQVGDPATAREHIRRALERDPECAEAHARLAEAALAEPTPPELREHLLEDALAAARRAVELDSRCAEYWLIHGRVLCACRAHAEGLEALRRAREHAPSEARPAFMLALALLEHAEQQPAPGLLDEAISALRAATEQAPHVAAYHGWLGIARRRSLGRAGDLETRSLNDEQRATLEVARVALARALELAPDDPRWVYELSLVQQAQGQYADAVATLNVCLASACPEPVQLDAAQRAEMLRVRARSRFLLGETVAARADLEQIGPGERAAADQSLLGQMYLALGETAAAKTALALASAADPQDGRVQLLLGQAQAALGDPAAAVAALEKALELQPDDPTTAAALSDAYLAHGRHERAMHVAARAARMEPGNAAHHQRLATLYTHAGRLHEARAALINAVTRKADVPEWHAQMAEICLALGMQDAARGAYNRAVQLAPTDTRYRYALAQLLARQGRHAEARSELEAAVQHMPERGAWHYELGQIQEQLGNANDALDHYAAAVQRSSGSAAHWYALALAQYRGGNHEVALETVERGLARFGDDPNLHRLAGIIQEERQNLATAAWHYEIAVEQAPEQPEQWWRLGRIQITLGDLDAARNALERAVGLDPNSAEGHAGLARLLAGKDDDRATLLHIQRAADLQPMNAEYQAQLADVLERMRRFDDARAALERAVLLRPDDAEWRARYGEMALNLGRNQEALAAFEQAIRQRPDEPRYQFLAGKAHRRLKHYTRAIERFRKAVKLRPGYSEAIIELSTLGPLAFVAQHLRSEESEAA